MKPIHTISANILIQIEGAEPQQIGSIEIPIELTVGGKQSGLTFPPGVRGGKPPRGGTGVSSPSTRNGLEI